MIWIAYILGILMLPALFIGLFAADWVWRKGRIWVNGFKAFGVFRRCKVCDGRRFTFRMKTKTFDNNPAAWDLYCRTCALQA